MAAINPNDINWMLTVSSGRLRWWYKAGNAGHQVKGAVSLVSDGVFFRIAYDGALIDSDSLAVIRPVKGNITLPSCGGWKLEHRKIKSTNARGRAIVLSFDDQHHPLDLDRIQLSFPISDDNDDGKLFIMAIERAMEARQG